MVLLGIPLVLVGCSSDTWNTGWIRNSARDGPSRNACNDTFSMIGKGPRKRWSSFLKGGGLDIPQVYPDSVSNFEWRNWKVSRRGVDLILFEGTRYLVTKIQMELLEICHN